MSDVSGSHPDGVKHFFQEISSAQQSDEIDLSNPEFLEGLVREAAGLSQSGHIEFYALTAEKTGVGQVVMAHGRKVAALAFLERPVDSENPVTDANIERAKKFVKALATEGATPAYAVVTQDVDRTAIPVISFLGEEQVDVDDQLLRTVEVKGKREEEIDELEVEEPKHEEEEEIEEEIEHHGASASGQTGRTSAQKKTSSDDSIGNMAKQAFGFRSSGSSEEKKQALEQKFNEEYTKIKDNKRKADHEAAEKNRAARREDIKKGEMREDEQLREAGLRVGQTAAEESHEDRQENIENLEDIAGKSREDRSEERWTRGEGPHHGRESDG